MEFYWNFYYRVNEDYKKIEIWNNDFDMGDPGDPFRHVIWNSTGDSIIRGSMGGEMQNHDLNTPDSFTSNGACRQSREYISSQWDKIIYLPVPPQLKGSGFTTSAKRVGPLNPFYHCIRISPLIASPGQPTGFYWLSAASLQLTCGMSAIHPKQLPAINIFRNPGDENPVRVMNWCPWKPNVLFTSTSYPESSIRLHNETTGGLIDDFECASEVSGIQFNVELEQVATSHNDFSRVDATRHIHGEESTVQL